MVGNHVNSQRVYPTVVVQPSQKGLDAELFVGENASEGKWGRGLGEAGRVSSLQRKSDPERRGEGRKEGWEEASRPWGSSESTEDCGGVLQPDLPSRVLCFPVIGWEQPVGSDLEFPGTAACGQRCGRAPCPFSKRIIAPALQGSCQPEWLQGRESSLKRGKVCY